MQNKFTTAGDQDVVASVNEALLTSFNPALVTAAEAESLHRQEMEAQSVPVAATVPLIPDVPGNIPGSRFLLSRDCDGDLRVSTADGEYHGYVVMVDEYNENNVLVVWRIDFYQGVEYTDLRRWGLPRTYSTETGAVAGLVAALVCKIADEIYDRQNALGDLYRVNAAIPIKADALLAPHPLTVREFARSQPAGMFLAEVASRCGEGGKL